MRDSFINKDRRDLVGAAGLSAFAGLTGISQAQTRRSPLSPPVKVKLGIIRALYDVGSLIADAKGYFREEGLDIEIVIFPSAADSTQALSIGAIDVLASSPSATIFNSRQRDIDMTIVAGAGQHSPGHGVVSIVLRKDLLDSKRYQSAADLKGMKLATGVTSASHFLAVEYSTAAGLKEKEVEYVALGFGNLIVAMNNKAIDGGCINEPQATLMIERANGVRIATSDNIKPNFPFGYLMYGGLLAKKNTDAGRRYMVAYLRGLRDYRLAFGPDKKDTNDIIGILKKYELIISPNMPSLGLSEDGSPSFQRIEHFLEWHRANGAIRTMPDPKSVFDDSFRQYAVTQIKV